MLKRQSSNPDQETNPSMAVSEHSKEYPFAEEEEEYSESEGSHSDQDSDDSDKDPSYTILEKTSAKFSNLSIKNNKKSKARFVSRPLLC